jgi:GntR family transcriptional regulator, transcriptional repressor for pyruvate dehydrogenase complex
VPSHHRRRRLKSSDLVAREIVLDICASGLRAGDALPPQATLLKRYKVGRSSFHEALCVLEIQGLVEIRTGARGGVVVGAPTAENLARVFALHFERAGAIFEQLTEVMLVLYPLAAAFVASRDLSGADAELLCESAVQGCGSVNTARRSHGTLGNFHDVLSHFARNHVWSLILDAIGIEFAENIISASGAGEFRAQAISDHKRIAAAVLAKDPQNAQSAMLEHMQHMIEFYRGRIPSVFLHAIKWR